MFCVMAPLALNTATFAQFYSRAGRLHFPSAWDAVVLRTLFKLRDLWRDKELMTLWYTNAGRVTFRNLLRIKYAKTDDVDVRRHHLVALLRHTGVKPASTQQSQAMLCEARVAAKPCVGASLNGGSPPGFVGLCPTDPWTHGAQLQC